MAGAWPDLIKLWNQESGWSAYAVNPSSGAYGIPQSLGHGHPYNLGDYKAQIEWGINYIAGRYGNSQRRVGARAGVQLVRPRRLAADRGCRSP